MVDNKPSVWCKLSRYVRARKREEEVGGGGGYKGVNLCPKSVTV